MQMTMEDIKLKRRPIGDFEYKTFAEAKVILFSKKWTGHEYKNKKVACFKIRTDWDNSICHTTPIEVVLDNEDRHVANLKLALFEMSFSKESIDGAKIVRTYEH